MANTFNVSRGICRLGVSGKHRSDDLPSAEKIMEKFSHIVYFIRKKMCCYLEYTEFVIKY